MMESYDIKLSRLIGPYLLWSNNLHWFNSYQAASPATAATWPATTTPAPIRHSPVQRPLWSPTRSSTPPLTRSTWTPWPHAQRPWTCRRTTIAQALRRPFSRCITRGAWRCMPVRWMMRKERWRMRRIWMSSVTRSHQVGYFFAKLFEATHEA